MLLKTLKGKRASFDLASLFFRTHYPRSEWSEPPVKQRNFAALLADAWPDGPSAMHLFFWFFTHVRGTREEPFLPPPANTGWRATVATLKEASVEFEMVWDTEDAGFTREKAIPFTWGRGGVRSGAM